MKPEVVAGSSVWQAVFFSFAALVMLFQILRGWSLGLPRQLVRLGALASAYCAALFGGPLLLPFLRPLLQLPDLVLSALGGAILALVVYLVVNTIGALVFRRTAQQESVGVRFVYGITGATFGALFGLFFIWLTVMGIRSLGSIAEAQLSAHEPYVERPLDGRRASAGQRFVPAPPEETALAASLARLKKSLELGAVGDVVKESDVLPAGIYDTLTKLGTVFARRDSMDRFLAAPGVAELTANPKILALRADPQIQRMLQEGQLWKLVHDERLIEAVNDPELTRQLKKFEFKKALEDAAETK